MASLATLYITTTQEKELDSLYQVQHGVSIQPHSMACVPSQITPISYLQCNYESFSTWPEEVISILKLSVIMRYF